MMYKLIMVLVFLMGFQMTSVAQSSDSIVLRSTYFSGYDSKAAPHLKKVKKSAILVRLADERKRIAYMEGKGKTDQAKKLADELNSQNEKMIAAFKKYFNYCPVYFYYSSDASAVLKEKNYDLLWVDINEKANNVTFNKTPYILMYGPLSYVRYNDKYKFILYEWDSENIHPTSIAYPTIRMRKVRRLMASDNPSIDIDSLSDMELLIMGLDSAYSSP